MAEGIKELSREKLLAIFPLLGDDPHFKITSPASMQYNCIAWAYQLSDRWMSPKNKRLSGRSDDAYFWPQGLDDSINVATFIEMFEQISYQICQTWEHEDGYQKVALYVKPGTVQCLHVARELVDQSNCGIWTSKLGESNDIQHSSPYLLEGHAYGEVYCIMKKPCN
jgi:hypothetical protein